MLEIRVSDTLTIPSFAARDFEAPLVGSTGFATQAAAEAGTAVNSVMSPARVAQSIHAALKTLSLRDFGYTEASVGVDDIAAVLQTATDQARTAGGRRILIPPTNGLADTHIWATEYHPKSWCPLEGPGEGLCRILVNTDTPYKQVAATQLYGAGLSGVTMKAGASNADATVIGLTAAQRNIFENLRFEGFNSTSGYIMRLIGTTVTTFDEALNPSASSNTIFNTFRNIVAVDVGNFLRFFGHYGATTTPTPANSANVPDVVFSLNSYDNINLWRLIGCGFEFEGAGDHELFFGQTIINFGADNAIGFRLSSAATRQGFTGNAFTNSIKVPAGVFARSAAWTGLVGVQEEGWTYGNENRMLADITSGFTPVTQVDSKSYEMSHPELDPAVGFGLTRIRRKSKGYIREAAEDLLYNSGAAPKVGTEREDAHGAAVIGQFASNGRSSTSVRRSFNAVNYEAVDNTNGAEIGAIDLFAMEAGVLASQLRVQGGVVQIRDGVPAPAATVGKAKIYVDTADGDLKVRFGDGVIKTLATDV